MAFLLAANSSLINYCLFLLGFFSLPRANLFHSLLYAHVCTVQIQSNSLFYWCFNHKAAWLNPTNNLGFRSRCSHWITFMVAQEKSCQGYSSCNISHLQHFDIVTRTITKCTSRHPMHSQHVASNQNKTPDPDNSSLAS